MYHFRRIAKNSVVQALAFATQGLTEFIVALVLAREAGAERLGEFTTLVILAGVFAFIADYGLPGLLTREIARHRDDPAFIGRLINTAIGLVCVLSLVALALMVLLGVVSGYTPILLRALFLTAIALGFESLTMVLAAAFRGVETLERSSAVIAVMHGAFLVLSLIVIQLGARVDWLMAAYLLSRIVALVVALRFYRARFGRLQPQADRQVWWGLLKQGLPFSVNSIFSFAYSRLDIVILSYLAGNVAVGNYEVAYTLTMRLNLLARAVTFALYPFLSSQFVRDARSMRGYTAKGIHFLIIPGFLLATVLWMFGRDIVRVLYGEAFAETTSLALKLLALALPLRFIETLLAVSLDASNRAGRRATAVAMSAIVNTLLNVVLVSSYGLIGAVYATLLTEIMICVMFLWFLRDELRDIIEWRVFLAPACGTAIVLLAPYLLGAVNIWLSMSLSIALYVLAVVAIDWPSIAPLRVLATRRRS